jgi:SAM-dependent methyltransferase
MHRVNYDDIAALYDEPLRDHVVDRHLVAFLESRSQTPLDSPVRTLDIGCGTGKQIAANFDRFRELVMLGVDRFEGMLRIARRRCPRALLVQADGACLPLRDRSVDYATSQFSYQHVRRPAQLLRNVFRTLRPGGRFVMTNIDPWSMTGWLVYRYFPEAMELDRQDFVPVEAFVAMMRDAGFQRIDVTRSDLSKQESVNDFLSFASGRHRASQLMAIPDAAYAAGIRRLEDDLASNGGAGVVVQSEFVVVTVSGTKESF